MTENELREKVVKIAHEDLGAKQYSPRHRQIVKDFNSIPGMGDWFKADYHWCAAAVSVWGWRAGLTDIIYPSASCNAMINKYKKRGRWIENDAHVPRAGDIVMYDWEDSGRGDNQGEADHVGIVSKVSGKMFEVIEGNKHGAVGIRTLVIDGRYIRGYCVPNYAAIADKKIERDWTKGLQMALNAAYDLHLAVDGSCGPLTRQEIDHHYLWYVKQRPIVNIHVSWLQEALNQLGADLEIDGSFGPATDAALRNYQRREGLDVDGYAGVQTHLSILRKLG